MADLVPIPFGIQASEARSGASRLELLQNLYLEANPDQAVGPVTLYGTPGFTEFTTVGDGPIRGMIRSRSEFYVVSGDELYYIFPNGVTELVGVVDGTGPVSMINNRPVDGSTPQIAICTNLTSYAGNRTDGIVPLAEPNLIQATYQDGYGIFVQRGTESIFISALDDLTSIGALDFTTADVFPDNVVACISDHRELWVFGEDSTEIYVNTGNPSFPFERTASGFIERGCLSTFSVAKIDNKVIWLGSDHRVLMAEGYRPQPISTPAVTYEISTSASPETARAFTYRGQDDHQYYVLNFTDRTLVYDLTTGLWHKRLSPSEDRWRVDNFTRIWGRDLVGDFSTNQVYELDIDTYNEDSTNVVRRTVSPPLYFSDRTAVMHELRVDMEHGTETDRADPALIMLHWTDDYGHTWQGGYQQTAGAQGERTTQTSFFGLGSFRKRSYRLTISAAVKVAITGVYGRIEVLGH